MNFNISLDGQLYIMDDVVKYIYFNRLAKTINYIHKMDTEDLVKCWKLLNQYRVKKQ